jgi:hypothetical protein
MAAPLSKSYPAGVMLLRYRCLEGAPRETVTEAVNAED